MPDIHVREVPPEATEEILSLLRLGLGQGSVPRTAEFWNWKHVQNPFGPSYCLVAEADGRLVGLRTFMRWRFRADDREIAAVRAVDTVTHPGYRGRGIFTRLTAALLERVDKDGIQFVFNTPNRLSRPGYLKLGWRDVGRIPLLVRPLRLFSRRNDANCEPSASAAEADVGELGQLCEGGLALDSSRLHTPRDRAYFEWRYARAPGISYRTRVSRLNGEPIGAVTRQRSRRGRRELSLSELLLPRKPPSRRELAAFINEIARDSNADYVVAVRPPREAPAGRSAAGFWPLPFAGPRLVVRPLRTTHLPLASLSSWSLAAGDLELF